MKKFVQFIGTYEDSHVNRRIYKKMFLIMRLTMIFMFFACIQVSATGYAQITVSANNEPLQKVLKEIQKQSGYDFFYSYELIEKGGNVTVDIKNAPLKDAVNACIKGKDLTFSIVENTVVIKAKEAETQQQQQPVKYILKGKVTELNGTPVYGASVVVKGTSTGVATGEDGTYTLTLKSKKETIVVSFIGMKTKEVAYTGQQTLNISLEAVAMEVGELVVTGMFTRKAESFTGSAVTRSGEELKTVGARNVIQSLSILDPSFKIVENTITGSDPNALPNIQLRGQTGLPDLKGEYSSNPNLPLFIMDGFETSLQRVIDLDINRIKNITILKDAASKAIYGSKAANGVVVIETIRPKAGKLRFSYNGTLSVQAPDLSSYNLCNAREKLEVEAAGGIYSNTALGSTAGTGQFILKQKYDEILRMVESGVNTDWLSKPLQNGLGYRHSVRIEGGDESFLYGVDLMYNNVIGVMKGSDRKTLTTAISLNYNIKKFRFNNILTVSNNRSDNSPWGSFSQYSFMNPYLPYQDANGKILKTITTLVKPLGGGAPGAVTNSAVYNPAYNSTLNSFDYSKYINIGEQLSVIWNILPEFRAEGSLSVSKQLNKSDQYISADNTMFMTSEFTTEPSRKGRYTRGDGNTDNFSTRFSLVYAKNIKKHYITANAIGEYSSAKYESISSIMEGFPNDQLDLFQLGMQYMKNTKASGSENTSKDMSGIISTNYSYDDRYLFDVSFRGTKSSLYGKDHPWGTFWSTGIGWNVHREKFMKNINFIDQLKLRGTMGYTGSLNFSSTMTRATYQYYLDNSYTTFGYGAYLMALANPDLQWQRKKDLNVGSDFSIFRKLNIRFDYYISTTDAAITDITLPPSKGFTTYKANLGQIENKGYEIYLNYRAFTNADKRNSLNFFLSAAKNKNILKKISNSLQAWNKTQDATATYVPKVRFVEGESMDAIWAVKSLGIDPATGKEVYQKVDGTLTYVWDANDQIVAGNSLPKVSGNFGFNLQYKGFQLNTALYFQWGSQVYNSTLVSKVENADIYQNVDRRVLSDRWRKPGDISFFKDVASKTVTRASTRFIEKDNRVTFSSFNLTYDFERFKSIKALGFSRLRAGFSTNEVFVLSTVRTERGTSYPFARTFQFTLEASF